MLATGIANSLFTKWQDMQCVGNCDDPDVSKHIEFTQPVWQTVQMFVGECLCLLPIAVRYARRRWGSDTKSLPQGSSVRQPLLSEETERDREDEETALADGADVGAVAQPRSAFLFFAPAVCDICGTTLMNVGLLFTPVSIYQ